MKNLLYNIIKIQSGLFAKPQIDGEVYYVQVRHFDKNRQFDLNTQPDLRKDEKIEKHLLRKGDVLLAAKGNDNFAVVYRGRVEFAVASPTFLVLRIKEESHINPDYLAWFLNTSQTQQYLQKNSAQGTSIAAITKEALGQLEIPTPSLIKQEAIVKLDELRKEEHEIKKQIEALKEKHLQYELVKAINN